LFFILSPVKKKKKAPDSTEGKKLRMGQGEGKPSLLAFFYHSLEKSRGTERKKETAESGGKRGKGEFFMQR